MIVIDTVERKAVASPETAYYYQPESFSDDLLVAIKEPFHAAKRVSWRIPEELGRFKSVAWTAAAQ